jgi:hypothetical protein
MALRTKVFLLFAIGILFSILREWSAPVSCFYPGLSELRRTHEKQLEEFTARMNECVP